MLKLFLPLTIFVQSLKVLEKRSVKIFKYIDTANNGQEGLQKYNNFYKENNFYYDIVISDLSMPILNGSELCKILLQENPKQFIIILSAHTESEEYLSLKELNINRFIQKPIKKEALLEMLVDIVKELKKQNDI